jgi:hypothetical protein
MSGFQPDPMPPDVVIANNWQAIIRCLTDQKINFDVSSELDLKV